MLQITRVLGIHGRWSGLLALNAILLCASASAATITWTGASSGAWSDGTNWDLSRAPTTGDDVVLTGAGTNPTNQDIIGLNIISLTFDATATSAFAITGNTITLTSSGTAVSVDPAAANHTIGVDLLFANSHTWSIGRDVT